MLSSLPSMRSAAQRQVTSWLRSPVVAALSEPRGVDHYLALIAPSWSTHEVRARVIETRRESADSVSLWLAPNANWNGFVAGQHVSFSVVIEGVKHTRTFSISSAPRAGQPLRITIRGFAGGRVSSWAQTHAKRGDLVVLGEARGEFVLPQALPEQLLFISGGSGITPVMAMLDELQERKYRGAVTCMHYARTEIMFRDEIEKLEQSLRGFRFVPYLCGEPSETRAVRAPRARFSVRELEQLQPKWMHSEAYVCGPASLERSVTETWAQAGVSQRLHVERFRQLPARLLDASALMPRKLVFGKSGVQVQGHGSATLLEQAEQAGLKPAYGCRMGICHTCKCVKKSGVVHDAITGKLSSADEEPIRLCISTPMSDVTLDL
jgi:ferredoxin-NADP reductase